MALWKKKGLGWPPIKQKWDEDLQMFVDVEYAPEKEPSLLNAVKVDPYIIDKFGNYKDPHKLKMFTSIDDENIGIRKNIRQGTIDQSNIWPMKDYQEFENMQLDSKNYNKVFWPELSNNGINLSYKEFIELKNLIMKKNK